ncbi:MAG: hypothetical protein REI94_17885 [Moraxellaceae bacterium]|nr:hypothetical protein [Moraxellaceae bacterium]
MNARTEARHTSPAFRDPMRPHDPRDPDPWHALMVDTSIPIDPAVKQAWLEDSASPSRQYLLPLLRPFARAAIVLVQVLKLVLPKHWQSSSLLHRSLVFGLQRFVSPQANWLIMRHFHLGAEIQQFILRNLPGVEIPPLHFMRFRSLEELRDDAFLRHDLNLYNFVIWVNQALHARGQRMQPPPALDLSMITDGGFPIDSMPQGRWNRVDLLTAIEVYTPVYQFFLTDTDFWRAANSLQLDETIALYASRILDDPLPLLLVNNKHPMIPMTTLRAGFRLVLHGLATEMLHAYLVQQKRALAAQADVPAEA